MRYNSGQDASASKVFLRSANPPSVTHTVLKDSSSKVNAGQPKSMHKRQCGTVNAESQRCRFRALVKLLLFPLFLCPAVRPTKIRFSAKIGGQTIKG